MKSFQLKSLNKKWKRTREYDQEVKHKHRSKHEETQSVSLSQEPTESVVSSQTNQSETSTVSYAFEHQSEKRPHPIYTCFLSNNSANASYKLH